MPLTLLPWWHDIGADAPPLIQVTQEVSARRSSPLNLSPLIYIPLPNRQVKHTLVACAGCAMHGRQPSSTTGGIDWCLNSYFRFYQTLYCIYDYPAWRGACWCDLYKELGNVEGRVWLAQLQRLDLGKKMYSSVIRLSFHVRHRQD